MTEEACELAEKEVSNRFAEIERSRGLAASEPVEEPPVEPPSRRVTSLASMFSASKKNLVGQTDDANCAAPACADTAASLAKALVPVTALATLAEQRVAKALVGAFPAKLHKTGESPGASYRPIEQVSIRLVFERKRERERVGETWCLDLVTIDGVFWRAA